MNILFHLSFLKPHRFLCLMLETLSLNLVPTLFISMDLIASRVADSQRFHQFLSLGSVDSLGLCFCPSEHFTVAKFGRRFHKACDGRVMCMQVNTLLIENDLRIFNMNIFDYNCEHSSGSFDESAAHPPEGLGERNHDV